MLIPTANRLYCLAWNRIYVKSNGRIPCWCDAGEPHTILMANLYDQDFITEVVNSPAMRAMRLKILNEQQHYNEYCQRCCFLQEIGRGRNFRHQDHIPETKQTLSNKILQATRMLENVARVRLWEYGSIDRIAEIQLEPSFACNLRCPGCLHGWHAEPMKSEEKPYFFQLQWFCSMLDSITNHGVALQKLSFIGRGEPTLNKQLPEMILRTRHQSPETIMSMDTNATQECKEEYLALDWVNCSIDGSSEAAYKTYRHGGDFLRAIRFMRKAVYYKAMLNSGCKIIWKYILFDSTSDTKLLNKAQQMAKDLGIDELNFVITACGAFDGSVIPSRAMNTVALVSDYINKNKIFENTIVSMS